MEWEKVVPWLIIVGVLAVIGGLIWYGFYLERKRREAWQLWSALRTYEYAESGYPDGWGDRTRFYLFEHGTETTFKNILRGNELGYDIWIFDYSYTEGSGKSKRTHTQTVMAFKSEQLRLPECSLRPESVGRWLAAVFGYQDIDFPDDPKFSKEYLVRGTNELAVRELLNDEIRDSLRGGSWNIEMLGDRLLIYVESTQFDADEANERIFWAADLVDRLQKSQPR